MLDSLLIANRGEIARRIIRTARSLGIRSVAVYSDVDRCMPFVHEADDAIAIGPAPASQSYLVGSKILDAARMAGVAAIHPGYGFLSENADFAEAVLAAGLIWIGAPPAAIRAMGFKDAAKRVMHAAGIPVTPGYLGDDQSVDRLAAEAEAIGYPVLIKAVAGGGGKGMRRVDESSAFNDALLSCQRESRSSFGDDRVIIEKYIWRPRHIEVQIFGDTYGNIVHLFERDCSLQRRHQKVIEEAPAPGMDAAIRETIYEAAVKAARVVDYVGAGTVEFIADASDGLRHDRVWFMEMNTRLQVEHPVTEAVTGQDLVEWQLRVASGQPLPRSQRELSVTGFAIEARLYAENPAAGFLPSTGPLHYLKLPDSIRVDGAVEEGCEVTSHYDPLIAKLIAHAPSRSRALERLSLACRQVMVWPVKTNAAFLARALSDQDFVAGRFDTSFIERRGALLIPDIEPDSSAVEAAGHALVPKPQNDPWTTLPGFRIAGAPLIEVALEIGGHHRVVKIDRQAGSREYPAVSLPTGEMVLFADGQAWSFGFARPDWDNQTSGDADGIIVSPMPGRVTAIEVVGGERVTKGQKLVALEAMKMEHTLVAPFEGRVTELSASLDSQVNEGDVLLRIEHEQLQ